MKIRLTLLCMLIIVSLHAQTRAGGGAFSFGVQSLPVDELVPFAPNAPAFGTTNFSWGGYGYVQLNKFLLGFKGAGIYGSELIDDANTYKVTGGYFALDFGYKVIETPTFFAYPFVGVGSGGVAYSVSSKFSLDLDDPQTESPIIYEGTYRWSNVVFDVGVRLEQLFATKTDERESKSGLVGLEVGYMFSPTNAEWRTSSKATIQNAPEYNMNGYYVRLTIGGFRSEPK